MNTDTTKKRLITSTLRGSVVRTAFISILLSASAYTLYLLVMSGTRQQGTIFWANPNDFFMDFFNVLKYISTKNPYTYTDFMGLGEKAYPPLAYLILYPFSRLYDYVNNPSYDARSTQFGIMSVVFFLGVCVFFLTFLYSYHIKGSAPTKILTTMSFFLSGIFLYSLERANIIFISVLFLGVFLLWYKSENPVLREMAYIALAFAAALKVYPALFGILIIKDKRWFASIRTLIYGAAAFFFPFFFFKGGLSNIGQLLANVTENTRIYQFLTPAFKLGWLPFFLCTHADTANYQSWVTFGNVLMVSSIVLCFFLKSQWKTAALLACVIIASPANSAYYCGLYLIVPIILFLNEKEHNCFSLIYMLLFILFLNPYQIINNDINITIILANYSLLCLYLLLFVEAIVRAGVWLGKQIKKQKLHPVSLA